MATEKDLEKSDFMKYSNIIFDESGYFLLYPTLLGVKIVNTFTNKCVKVLGKTEHLRPLCIALFQVSTFFDKKFSLHFQSADKINIDFVRL